MDSSDLQQNLIDTINLVVDGKIGRMNIPLTQVGRVVQDPTGYEVVVELNDTEQTCTLPEHLHNWISKDDIVYVQDALGNGQELVVIGSSGSTRNSSMVITDSEHEGEKGKEFISGVTKLENTDGALDDPEIFI